MTSELPALVAFISQLIGALACVTCLSCLQWLNLRDSMTPPQTPVLVQYLLINVVCFAAAVFIVRFFSIANRFLGYVMLAATGALLSSLLIDIRYVLHNWGYREITEGHSWRFITSALYIATFNGLIALFILSILFGVAFVVLSIHNYLGKPRAHVSNGI